MEIQLILATNFYSINSARPYSKPIYRCWYEIICGLERKISEVCKSSLSGINIIKIRKDSNVFLINYRPDFLFNKSIEFSRFCSEVASKIYLSGRRMTTCTLFLRNQFSSSVLISEIFCS